MLVFWTLRALSAMAWFCIFVFLILIPLNFFGFGLSPQTGVLRSLPGMLFTLVFAVALFAVGLTIRIGSQRRSLGQLATSKSAQISFSGSLDSASSRWLIHQNENRRLRLAAPPGVYVVATDIGLEIYWPLQLPTQLLIHVIKWDEIADFSVRQRTWLANEAIVKLRGEQRALRIRLTRTSLFSSERKQGDDLQIAVHLRLS